jgi:lipopolysaccharide export system protein LptC
MLGMDKLRPGQRWRVLLTIVVGVFLALGSFWLVQVMNRPSLDIQSDPNSNLPDYIVDRFSFVRLTPAGQPTYIISGIKLTHRPLDDSSVIDLPYVRSLSDKQEPTEMHAKLARVDQGNSRVHLTGDVDVARAASATAQKMTLKTQALTVYPDSDRMETDQPVEVVLGQTVMTGTGMKANNATRQIDVSQRLHITYPPAPR